MSVLAHLLLSLAATVALVPACRRVALHYGYFAEPKRDRWHRRRAPLLGGLAIAVVVLFGGLTIRPLSDVALLLGAGLAAVVVGLVDDIVVLRPATKLVAQIVLASTVVYFGYRLQWFESMTADAMLTMFWIIGVTNAFNLLDNMDGLAAGIGIIVAVTLLAGFLGDSASGAQAKYLALMIGALGGFLIYNFNPASIFMGDSGSLFIGAWKSQSPNAGERSTSTRTSRPVTLSLGGAWRRSDGPRNQSTRAERRCVSIRATRPTGSGTTPWRSLTSQLRTTRPRCRRQGLRRAHARNCRKGLSCWRRQRPRSGRSTRPAAWSRSALLNGPAFTLET